MSEKKTETQHKTPEHSEQTEIQRRFKQHPFVFIGTVLVLIIVIIAFVLVPAIVPGEGIASSQLNFGYWDNKPITYSSGGFFASMREQYSSIARVYQMSEYQVWRNAFEATVVRTAVLDIMNKSGYTPSKVFVDKRVAALPQFQENGRFSAIRYKKIDAASRIKLWQDMANDAIVERYHDDVGTIKSVDAEADFFGQMALPQRKFKFAIFPYSSYPNEEAAVYANENPDMFKTVYLSQITVSGGEREAQAILDKLRSNDAVFEDVARTQSEDNYADLGGDSGARMAYELSLEIPDEEQRRAVINLAKGEISDVVKLPAGWVIFRANDPSRSSDLQDVETLNKVRLFLMDNERGIIEDWLIARAENFAQRVRGAGFDTVAAGESLNTYELGALPLNYGDNPLFPTASSFQVSGMSGISTDENFWRTAFSTPVGEPSRPVVLGGNNDSIVILYPYEEIVDDVSIVENSKTSFSGWWLENQTQRNITDTILTSKKFDDKFISTYFRLFAGS
ncbi:MAG: peptidylprolyl isomerase [Spirochaetaceae bacterium]|jgi:hypothetical protein|nr:peptidylprolyl isomerase [Spirochaetaceae bacterium]